MVNVMEFSGSFTGSYDENGNWVGASSTAAAASYTDLSGDPNAFDEEQNEYYFDQWPGYVADTFANASSSIASQQYAAGINSEEFLMTCAQCHEWHLDERPLMPLKALISVPSEIFDAIEEDSNSSSLPSSN